MLLPTSCPLCSTLGPAPCRRCMRKLSPPERLKRPAHVDSVAAAVSFDGAARDLLLGLKYASRRDALPWMVSELASLAPVGLDVIAHVPTSHSRRGRRGFDQGAALARGVRRELALPRRQLLTRRSNQHQTGQSASQRRIGPSFDSVEVTGLRVLLVDDVMTTGATLTSAARALRERGASEVHAVVVAYTPPRKIERRNRSKKASLPPMG